MPVLENIGLLATCRAAGGQGELNAIPDAALVWEGDTIQWVGPAAELPPAHRAAGEPGAGPPPTGSGEAAGAAPRWDAGGRLVVPGLVDCHTHLAFAGWRAGEFTRRIQGATYREIARAGGGIASTVRATRRATEQELLRRCESFLAEARRLGVTTVEAKSGYGLNRDDELKQLRVYRALGGGREGGEGRRPGGREGGSGGAGGGSGTQPTRVVPTFLGAHVVPPEYEDDREGYLDLLTAELIPAVAREGLARCCDAFVEETAFSVEEARHVLEAGRRHGLAPKLHADQLSDVGGAALAAEVGALSADHLEHASDEGVQAMAREGVVAVDLPLASLYLDQPPMDARRFVEAGVPVAVATDFNPGTAPSLHLPVALTLACTRSRLTPAEALKGGTLYAARAVGLEDRIGSLEPGKAADFAVLDAPDPEHWLYRLRENACSLVVAGGERRWVAPDLRDGGRSP